MDKQLSRRVFLSSAIGLPALLPGNKTHGLPLSSKAPSSRLKTSLNAYSFNAPLMNGSMTLGDLLTFCANTGFDAVDITGYYFKGYPQVPTNDYLYAIKRNAFALGLEISGTGVRNDFTLADKTKRQAEVDLVKQWVEAAAKVGAPVLRIFAGTQKNESYTKQQVTEWMLKDIQACVDFGKQHGIIIGLQNHNDFIQTSGDVIGIMEAINSPWLGLILDTGSYRIHNAYDEIASTVKYAVNWQIKEKIFINGTEADTDIDKVMAIIRASDYRGYLPIETLGAGDPKIKVPLMLEKLKQAMT
jgi:sugar phosphate isomerase/epimerase